MALKDDRKHDVSMNNIAQRPRKGDRVQINGFLGVFEVVRVENNGSTADLKHLGVPGPDYIEKEILSHELVYPNARQIDHCANLSTPRGR
jgi:hypothetical protein